MILTTNQVAKILGYSVSTVMRACDDGKLPCFRTPGGHRRIHMSDLRDFMARKEHDRNDYFAQ